MKDRQLQDSRRSVVGKKTEMTYLYKWEGFVWHEHILEGASGKKHDIETPSLACTDAINVYPGARSSPAAQLSSFLQQRGAARAHLPAWLKKKNFTKCRVSYAHTQQPLGVELSFVAPSSAPHAPLPESSAFFFAPYLSPPRILGTARKAWRA